MKFNISLLLFFLMTSIAACSAANSSNNHSSDSDPSQIILATTTSTQDSGLLDYLLPVFHDQNEYLVKTIAVGTGKALRMAEEGNADVLLVHAPSAELELMEAGFGAERNLIMHNDFVIIGPPEDPAGIRGVDSPVDSLQMIQSTHSSFLSRGDDSGTHKKEIQFWNELGVSPQGSWYLESGQGMAASLRIASEKDAYTLTDRATFLANRDILHSDILVEGHNQLLNIYHVIVVNPEVWPGVNYEGAVEFAKFLISDETQSLIGKFGIEKYGQPLFTPDAGKTASELGLD